METFEEGEQAEGDRHVKKLPQLRRLRRPTSTAPRSRSTTRESAGRSTWRSAAGPDQGVQDPGADQLHPLGDPRRRVRDVARGVLKLPGYRADKNEDIADAKKLLAEAGLPTASRGSSPGGLGGAARRDPGAGLPGAAQADAQHRGEDQHRRAGGLIRGAEARQLRPRARHARTPPVRHRPAGNVYFKTRRIPELDRLTPTRSSTSCCRRRTPRTTRRKRAKLFREMEDLLDQEPPWHDRLHLPPADVAHTVKGLALDRRVRRCGGDRHRLGGVVRSRRERRTAIGEGPA